MDWLVSLVGVGLVLTALRDLFHTLWHPTRRGGQSRLVMRALWRVSHRLRTRGRAAGLAGPLAMVLVVTMWAATIIVGWALIYWPHMPEGFVFNPGLTPEERSNVLDSFYVSIVMMGTLGLGDIAPTEGWLRVAAPVQALVGFVLLSAVVSWVLEIYPALMRRRTLALRLSLLRRADPSPRQLDSAAGASLLESLSTDVARVRVDFSQYPEAYYFHDGEDDTALAASVGYAAELAQHWQTGQREDVRLTAAMLAGALDDLAAILDQHFLHTGGTPMEVFSAYAADRGRA
ncbi:potassium channel family protein [Streptomyces gobiensis]|uniref:potassium channel family protein n=1 Tax=Streptomyces gobiensis TaxID=2875706 RepID=UPI001E493E98|nr:potassium channel family protein [Streptomyces gobiensis]UGY94594.1 potassium channel family protein [Streptomyces gobiensis]